MKYNNNIFFFLLYHCKGFKNFHNVLDGILMDVYKGLFPENPIYISWYIFLQLITQKNFGWKSFVFCEHYGGRGALGEHYGAALREVFVFFLQNSKSICFFSITRFECFHWSFVEISFFSKMPGRNILQAKKKANIKTNLPIDVPRTTWFGKQSFPDQ